LAAPKSFERVWTFKGSRKNFGDCTIWKPIAPPDYVSLGHVATLDDNPPSLDSVRCVHKAFVTQSEPLSLSRRYPYLWSSYGSLLTQTSAPVSVWLIKPRLDSFYCNTFVVSHKENPPSSQECFSLAMRNSEIYDIHPSEAEPHEDKTDHRQKS